MIWFRKVTLESILTHCNASQASAFRKSLPLFVVVGLCLFSGCSRFLTDYGATDGRSATQSINGFSTLREAYESAGCSTADVHRLHDRSAKHDAMVWVPRTVGPIDPAVSRWMHNWLGSGGHTLVYIVPDSGSEADYWDAAIKIAPPEQRLEYRRRRARAITERTQWRLNRMDWYSNGWFKIESFEQRVPVDSAKGPWGAIVSGEDSFIEQGTADDAAQTDQMVGVEFGVIPYDKKADGSATTGGTTSFGMQTGPSSTWGYDQSSEIHHTTTSIEPLVLSRSGGAAVAEITSQRWRDSRIIIVAGGSLMTNFALTRPVNRRLADAVIRASLAPKASALEVSPPGAPISTDAFVGFITTNAGSIPVSEADVEMPKPAGIELLTTLPISMVSIHTLFLGFIICMVIFPIFGRPKKLKETSKTSFGLHIDAVALLMQRVGDISYARQRISQYMRRIRGETSGPWVLPEGANAGGAVATKNSQSVEEFAKQFAGPTIESEPKPTDQTANPFLDKPPGN